MHPPPSSSFQSPPRSLQHPLRYKNKYIASYWAVFPNLDRKIQSCPFCLKIDTHVSWRWWFWIRIRFSRLLTQNPFLGSRKNQICPFCLKIDTQSISRMLIVIPTLVFRISNPKFIFAHKVKPRKLNFLFRLMMVHIVSPGADLFHMKPVTGEEHCKCNSFWTLSTK